MAELMDARDDVQVRAVAKSVGLIAWKSRGRLAGDNHGGFQLLDPDRRWIVAGEAFDLTAKEVLAICAERAAAFLTR
jgi:hypothetical protein